LMVFGVVECGGVHSKIAVMAVPVRNDILTWIEEVQTAGSTNFSARWLRDADSPTTRWRKICDATCWCTPQPPSVPPTEGRCSPNDPGRWPTGPAWDSARTTFYPRRGGRASEAFLRDHPMPSVQRALPPATLRQARANDRIWTRAELASMPSQGVRDYYANDALAVLPSVAWTELPKSPSRGMSSKPVAHSRLTGDYQLWLRARRALDCLSRATPAPTIISGARRLPECGGDTATCRWKAVRPLVLPFSQRLRGRYLAFNRHGVHRFFDPKIM